ncbi:hypothetical protein GEMRC1_006769 [Eukaryota sp. GEM-RC1]
MKPNLIILKAEGIYNHPVFSELDSTNAEVFLAFILSLHSFYTDVSERFNVSASNVVFSTARLLCTCIKRFNEIKFDLDEHCSIIFGRLINEFPVDCSPSCSDDDFEPLASHSSNPNKLHLFSTCSKVEQYKGSSDLDIRHYLAPIQDQIS